MNLDAILIALCDDLGYGDASVVSPGVRTRLIRYVNEGYRHILSMSEFAPLRSQTLPFASEANRKVYGFPQTFVQIDQMVDTTNAIRLRLMTQDYFRTIDPQETSGGTPTHYVPLGYGPVLRELTAPTGIWAVSSVLADVAKVGVLGIRTSGLPTTMVTTSLTGTARVQVGTFTDYIAIQQVQVQNALGTVQFFDAAAAGNLLAHIVVGFNTVQYQQIRLWPTPAGIYQYQIDGSVNVADLTLNNFTLGDEPLLPVDFQYVLCDYARMKEYEFRDDSRVELAGAQYTAKLKQMRDRIMDPPDYRPRVGRLPDRSSNLGS